MNVLGRNPLNLQALFESSPLTKDDRAHLSKVYSALSATAASAAAGVYAQGLVGWESPWLLFFVGLGLMLYISFTSHSKSNILPRGAALLGFGFVQGMTIGPLVNFVLDFDPEVVLIAVLGTLVIFLSFTMVAFFSNQRTMFFIGAIIGSFFNILFFSSLLNIFFHTRIPSMLNLYGGLFIFSLYVIYDTQLILFKRKLGDNDFIRHAVDLFLDLLNIFIRILVIILKNRDQKKEKRERK